ncbi:hypothetical protein ANCDUO_00879 [Ancylostoma duodenale]|uniref:Peptidase A2 domain-containing protein n=1 Tax=Ancylostoma duodenale TaxID=51022 RepID=A0A0C2E0B4_9BILA|nr:hypothetical protein ANCDUO_00879 [Ancylostoma duodenale]
MQVEALLDTGSETSIIPLALFKFARESKVDLDKYVKRIPTVDAVIRNASGDQMKFVDTIRMEVRLNGKQDLVAFHVGRGLDRLVILGTCLEGVWDTADGHDGPVSPTVPSKCSQARRRSGNYYENPSDGTDDQSGSRERS